MRYATAFTLLGVVGCDAADDPDGTATAGDDTDGNTGGNSPNDGNGQFVRCCYFAANNYGEGRQACVPQNSAYHACVDPADSIIDADGSGDISTEEFADFCNQKVPNNISVLNPWEFPLLPPDEMNLLDIEGPWIAANALGGSLFGSCVPDPNPTVDYPATVAPTHEGTFTSKGKRSSSVGIELDGVHRVLAADGRFEMALFNCDSKRHTEICDLELRWLDLELHGPAEFTNYSVDTALLSLNSVGRTSVTFDCSDRSSCNGTFDFDSGRETDLEVLLTWDQTNLSTGTVGGGTLLLGDNGLAKMTHVTGELKLNSDKEKGSLSLRGKGADKLDGSFVSVDFDITGPVSPHMLP